MTGRRRRDGELAPYVSLYREPDQPLFDVAEQRFMQSAASVWPKGPAGRCCSGRRPIPRARRHPGSWCCPPTGRSSRVRLARSSGWPN